MKTLRWSLALLLLPAACGPETKSEPIAIDTIDSYVAPAGSDVSYPANTVPTIMAPGERFNISVTAQNDGAASPANDWGVNQYSLFQQNTTFQATAPRVLTATPINNQYNYRVVITAPQTPGPHTFAARTFSLVPGQTGYFGPTLTVPNITTDANRRPFWDCTLQGHDIPATMTPDEVRTVNITVINSGTEDWPVNNVCLRSTDTPLAEWGGATCPTNNALVAGSAQGTPLGTGNTHTFTFSIRAPTTPGNYTFTRQNWQLGSWTTGSVGPFRVGANCVDIPVTVAAGGVPWDATFDAANSNIPITVPPGDRREVTVRMTNTGTNQWPGNGTVGAGNTMLYTRNTPANLWGSQTIIGTPAPVDPGNSADFTFVITAPAAGAPTVFNFNWQMFGSITGVGFFGETVPTTITVDPAAQPSFDAAVVAEVYPIMSPLRPDTFRITMQNTGTEPWPVGFTLQSVNTPVNLFGTASAPLNVQVDPGNNHEFVFAVQGPQNSGMFTSQWRMRHSNAAIGNFGATTNGMVTVLDNCGNNVLDAGEQCDDGNAVGGDGCSAGCQIEQRIFDGTAPADRSFLGSVGTRSLDRVAIGGDLNGNGTPDLAIGADGVPPPALFRAGAVYLVEGGGGFFNNTEADPAGAAWLRVDGARANDFLSGTIEGRIQIGDVTGDGTPDLLVSAPAAACAGGMGNCGAAYVIRGGASLGATPGGVLNLATPTADVVATLTAPNDGDHVSVIGIGELTGDAFNDIVLGLPGTAVDTGRVVVVAGGPALTSITLNAASVFAEFNGLAAGDLLGLTAAVGDISGDGAPDLIMASSAHSLGGGGAGAGAAWAYFGPLNNATAYNLATNFNARWLGAGVRDGYGTGLAIGDVFGNGDNDLIIGGDATRFAPNNRYGSVDVWTGPVANGTTFDLSAAATPNLRYQGVDQSDGFGHCVAVGEFSNINNGGKADIIGVATFSQGNGNPFIHAGETHLFMGDPAAADAQVDPNTTLSTVYGPATAARPCYYRGSLTIGDIDNDGDNDFCVSARGASGARGRVDCVMNAWN